MLAGKSSQEEVFGEVDCHFLYFNNILGRESKCLMIMKVITEVIQISKEVPTNMDIALTSRQKCVGYYIHFH